MGSVFRSLLAVAALASVSMAFCIPQANTNPTPSLPLSELAANTGASALPTPTTTPKAITLGIGSQNYTCSGGVYIQTVASSGALAELFDLSGALTRSDMDSITPNALTAYQRCTSAPSFVDCYAAAAAVALERAPNHVGTHFFTQSNGAQTPHFALDEYDLYLAGKKTGSVAAPSSADPGANGLGAVAWLYLISDGESYTQGLTAAYRVETAGGVAPSSCTTAGATLEVPYAAQYWFFD